MTYAVLRLLYGLWLLGAAILFANAASRSLFGRERMARKLKRTASALLIAGIWPVALFSPAGRRVLLNRINQL